MSYKENLGSFPCVAVDVEGTSPSHYEFAAYAVNAKRIVLLAAGPIRQQPEDLPRCARINENLIAGAPTPDSVIKMMSHFLKGKHLIHFGSWDRKFLKDAIDSEKPPIDLMEMVAPFVSSFDTRRNNWPWAPLERVAKMANISYPDPGPHNAISDAWVTARLAQILINAPDNKLELLLPRTAEVEQV